MWGSGLEEVQAVEIMKYMHWSYDEYLNCPLDIIQAIAVRMEIESKK